MLKVAITGNIASGKSQVEKILLDLGYKVADTDKINHSILEADFAAISEIKSVFCDDDILEIDGSISRTKLGKVVFSDKDKLNVYYYDKDKLTVVKEGIEVKDGYVTFITNGQKNYVITQLDLIQVQSDADKLIEIIKIGLITVVICILAILLLPKLLKKKNQSQEPLY